MGLATAPLHGSIPAFPPQTLIIRDDMIDKSNKPSTPPPSPSGRAEAAWAALFVLLCVSGSFWLDGLQASRQAEAPASRPAGAASPALATSKAPSPPLAAPAPKAPEPSRFDRPERSDRPARGAEPFSPEL